MLMSELICFLPSRKAGNADLGYIWIFLHEFIRSARDWISVTGTLSFAILLAHQARCCATGWHAVIGRLPGLGQFSLDAVVQLFNPLLSVDPAGRIAFPKHFAVGTDQVRKRPSGNSVGFGVLASFIPKDRMLEFLRLHHAAHDWQGLPETPIDLNDNESNV
jgi:hypothetical protein